MAAAAVPAFVSLEEYLHGSYEPDVDYVDGVLEERNLGEIDHGALQRELLYLLFELGTAVRARVFPETRVQVSSSRFRIPDICVMPAGWHGDRIIHTAPVVCLEILSPEDRMSRVLRRARDFFAMGVPEIWIFDPEEHKAYRLLPGGTLQEVSGHLALASGEITLDLDRLFQTP